MEHEPTPPAPPPRRRLMASRMYLVSPAELIKLGILAAVAGFLIGRWL